MASATSSLVLRRLTGASRGAVWRRCHAWPSISETLDTGLSRASSASAPPPAPAATTAAGAHRHFGSRPPAGAAHRERMEAIRESLREQLFEEGATQHTTKMLAALSDKKHCSDAKALAIVGHLLYEGLLFHHKHFTVALSGLAIRGLWRAAGGLLEEMRDRDLTPNTITYNAALNACRKGQAWERAIGLLEDMRANSAQEDVVTYSTMVMACEKASQWPMALDFFHALTGAGLQPDKQSVSAAISACASGQKWQLATQLVSGDGGGPKLDIVCYNGVIKVCSAARQWTKAVELLSGLQTRGPAPDDFTYNSTISACEVALQWQQALCVFEDMKQRKVAPKVVTYNSAINACFRGEKWEGALALFDEMLAAGVKPTVVTCGAMLAALTPARKWQEALSVVDKMQQAGVDLDRKACGALVALMFASGENGRAIEFYRNGQAMGLYSPWSEGRTKGLMDLHGHVIFAALTAVQSVFDEMISRPAGRYFHDPRQDLIIITGRGQNSSGQESRLIPALTTFLRQEFHPPLDLVPAKQSKMLGRWMVPKVLLMRWVDAQRR